MGLTSKLNFSCVNHVWIPQVKKLWKLSALHRTKNTHSVESILLWDQKPETESRLGHHPSPHGRQSELPYSRGFPHYAPHVFYRGLFPIPSSTVPTIVLLTYFPLLSTFSPSPSYPPFLHPDSSFLHENRPKNQRNQDKWLFSGCFQLNGQKLTPFLGYPKIQMKRGFSFKGAKEWLHFGSLLVSVKFGPHHQSHKTNDEKYGRAEQIEVFSKIPAVTYLLLSWETMKVFPQHFASSYLHRNSAPSVRINMLLFWSFICDHSNRVQLLQIVLSRTHNDLYYS